MSLNAGRAVLVLLACAGGSLAAQPTSTHGPAGGHLVLEGGVGAERAIDSAFVALAGGPRAHIVVIPTAGGPDTMPAEMADYLGGRLKERFGVSTVTVLHTLDRLEADAGAFVEPLRTASGVWILGGFPERLVQAYLGTRTERAIRELLDRGGVVGGESAGAMILASWLDTTDSQFTAPIRALIRAQGDRGGFGLLTGAAVFPHANKRGDEVAVSAISAHPDLLGIGIDEGTAVLVSADHAEVIGRGTVSLFDATGGRASSPVRLRNGDRYDLVARRKQ